MQEMYRQYGPELVDAVSREMIRHSETILKKRLREIPDGIWKETAVIQGDETWKTALTLRKEGERLIFDFSGTDKQAKTGINLPYHATFGACFESILTTIAHDLPKNHGLLTPIQVIAPEGSLVHVKPPGPVSMNTTSGGRTVKYLARSALNQMLSGSDQWRTEVVALSVGGRAARHAGVSQHGRYYVSGFALVLGGSGARNDRDGINSGTEGLHSCPNVEWVELNFPLLHLFRRQATDTGGPGKFRGGVGVETAVTVHGAPEGKVKIVAYGVAGLKNSGTGLFGGYRGAPSIVVLHEETRVRSWLAQDRSPVELAELEGKPRLLPYCDFDLKEGDVFYLRTQSGGGYGDPLEREPERVVADVVSGLVSAEAGTDIYGVVVDREGAFDRSATENQRERMRRERLKDALPGREVKGNETSYFPRALVEVASLGGVVVVRCGRCHGELGYKGVDWKRGCRVKDLEPTKAGPVMKELVGRFVLRQCYCPSCAALLDTTLEECEGPKEKERGENDHERP
jgi:N-methylhydantoinase B